MTVWHAILAAHEVEVDVWHLTAQTGVDGLRGQSHGASSLQLICGAAHGVLFSVTLIRRVQHDDVARLDLGQYRPLPGARPS